MWEGHPTEIRKIKKLKNDRGGGGKEEKKTCLPVVLQLVIPAQMKPHLD